MESQWGYNLQCNVIDNLLITNVVSSQQYHCNMNDPKQNKKSRNGEFTSSSKGGVQLAMYWVIRGRILVDQKKKESAS